MRRSTMNRGSLARRIHEQFELPMRTSIAIVDDLFLTIVNDLYNGGKCEIRGFGTFRVHHSKARKGRNPATGALCDIPARCRIKFRGVQIGYAGDSKSEKVS
jgi:DNA-binding protein HU-beta